MSRHGFGADAVPPTTPRKLDFIAFIYYDLGSIYFLSMSHSFGGLLKTETGSYLHSVGLAASLTRPRICSSDKFPGDADAAGPGTTL